MQSFKGLCLLSQGGNSPITAGTVSSPPETPRRATTLLRSGAALTGRLFELMVG
jgi:hypothetical protein